jgi:radical SAM superfamily enzyme YgiQ (UPF0313 family)
MNRTTDIVFVDNFFYRGNMEGGSVIINPHVGLLSLMACLGDRAKLFDPKYFFYHGHFREASSNFFEKCANHLLETNASIIGFTAYGRSLLFPIYVSSIIKRNDKNRKILLGGPHATIMGREILKAFPAFDIVVTREAEPIIEVLVDRLITEESIKDIPNLLYRESSDIVSTAIDSKLISLGSLKKVEYEPYLFMNVGLKSLPIEVGRGCPFTCNFCSTTNFFGRKYRIRAIDEIVHEIDRLHSKHGILSFDLNHDLFGLDTKYVEDFVNQMDSREISWTCSMRPDVISEKSMSLLKKSKCSLIYFGFESGSQNVQLLIQKKLDLEKALTHVKELAQAGIKTICSFIVGYPFETEEDLAQTIGCISNLLAMNDRCIRVQVHVLSPEPGTELYDQWKNKLEFDGRGPDLTEAILTQDATLIRRCPDIFSVYYHFPTLIDRNYLLYFSQWVNYELPRLGNFFLFVLKNLFKNDLQQFFKSVITEIDIKEHNLISTQFLQAYQRVFCKNKGDKYKFSIDYIEFLELIESLSQIPFSLTSPLNESQIRQVIKQGQLVEFSYPFEKVVKKISNDPCSDISEILTEQGEYKYYVVKDNENNILFYLLSAAS